MTEPTELKLTKMQQEQKQLIEAVEKLLKPNDTFKSYKDLCSRLKIKTKTGDSKISQIKLFRSLFDYHNEGRRIIIDSIYSVPQKIEDKRGKNNIKHFDSNFKIEFDNRNSIGVYAIVLDNNIYIGSTTVSFMSRYGQHKLPDNKTMSKIIINNENTDFICIENCNNKSEKYIRMREEYYINQFGNDENWILLNCGSTAISGKLKKRYKTIKVLDKQYANAIKLLKDNQIEIRKKGK